jgi:hypothetical protein
MEKYIDLYIYIFPLLAKGIIAKTHIKAIRWKKKQTHYTGLPFNNAS